MDRCWAPRSQNDALSIAIFTPNTSKGQFGFGSGVDDGMIAPEETRPDQSSRKAVREHPR